MFSDRNQQPDKVPMEELPGIRPMVFIPNKDQTNEDILYYSYGGMIHAAFTEDRILFNSDLAAPALKFVNRSPKSNIIGSKECHETFSYYIGNSPANWHTGLIVYHEIIYKELWDGIDLKFYESDRKLKYEFEIQPQAELRSIALTLDRCFNLSLDVSGNLLIESCIGTITMEKPFAYQENKKRIVDCRFFITKENSIGFETINGYDYNLPLIIDPGLAYSSFIGGDQYDSCVGIKADLSGNFYVAGYTNSSQIFGAAKSADLGSQCVFVVKSDALGHILYTALIGGSGTDTAFDIDVDPQGNTYITGSTDSPDFPTVSGAYQSTYQGQKSVFLIKLNQSGTSVLYGTYLSGTDGISEGYSIALDSSSHAVIAGYTTATDFPVKNAFQPALKGQQDAFIAKLNPEGLGTADLIFGTYAGGTLPLGNITLANCVSIGNSSDPIYVAGTTSSSDFMVTSGAYQPALLGASDAFFLKLSTDGGVLYSTYFGGYGSDTGSGIAVDQNGNIYIAGTTTSANLASPGAFQTTNFGTSYYVAKIDPKGSGSADRIYCTYICGTSAGQKSDTAKEPEFQTTSIIHVDRDVFHYEVAYPSDRQGNNLAVDNNGNAYIAGYTLTDFFSLTSDAYQTTPSNSFLAIINPTGTNLVYSTYFGGRPVISDSSYQESTVSLDPTNPLNIIITTTTYHFTTTSYQSELHALNIGRTNAIYLCGSTQDALFPVTSNAAKSEYSGNFDGFISVFKDKQHPVVITLNCNLTIIRLA